MSAVAFLLFGLGFGLSSGGLRAGFSAVGNVAVIRRYGAADFFLTTGEASTMGAFPDGS